MLTPSRNCHMLPNQSSIHKKRIARLPESLIPVGPSGFSRHPFGHFIAVVSPVF